MGKQPRSQPGAPMTLANMRSPGVRSLAVSCILYHHAARLDVDGYVDDATVPSRASHGVHLLRHYRLMRTPSCYRRERERSLSHRRKDRGPASLSKTRI
jgi:hypothetical protein